jgi:Zn ribbon nucleic-acid-binding protein
MSSVRETFGLACPKCGHDDELEVWAFTTVSITPHGSIEADHAIHEWSGSHHCQCRACGHEATVGDFTAEQ